MKDLIDSYPIQDEEFKWRKSCFVDELSEKVQIESCLMGWIHDFKIQNLLDRTQVLFLIFRDSTGLKEFQITKPELVKKIAKLERESVIAIRTLGTKVNDLKIISQAKPVPVLPCLITDHSSIDLVINRAYALRTERMKAILKIQDSIFSSVRKFFEKEKFYEIRPPIIAPATDPGIRGAKAGELDFYGKRYKLTTSMILYKQMAICSLERIYSLSPNIRLEDPATQETGRHLAEFYQIDVEQAFADYHDAMNLGEKLLISIFKAVKRNRKEELNFLERNLIIPTRPFQKLTYKKVLEKLREMKFGNLQDGQEIPWNAEKALSELFDAPFWITDYPYGSRGFYDRQNPENPSFLKDFDLMYPGGFGEAMSGSEREYLYEKVKRKMLEQGVPLVGYKWYFDMLQRGVPPSAGFGLGLERLTRYICGLEKIWEATAFPKVPGIHSP